ncbi:MAG: flavodoxin domain-containing protein [Deltaproteobacteria bacterium]|jgi:flavorubredoxin|nr:flavodoxin domain-containing protein [Deltaproteobacteria bacterium]
MSKGAVIFATRTNQTQKIAQLIAEGMRFEGFDVDLLNVNQINSENALTGYNAVVLGSATYHGEMLQSMKTFLFIAEKANLEGKAGGAFGAFGWSGEAPGRIFDTMTHILKMNMVGGPLRLKSADLGGGIKMAQDYGREVARKALGSK